jgi:hypothetical protein
MILSANEVASLTIQFWDKPEDQIIGIAVAYAESKFDTCAIGTSRTGENNGQQDLSLWQLSTRWNYKHFLEMVGDWRNPFVSTAAARMIWGEGGWELWHTFTSGSYKEYLPIANMALPRPIHIYLPDSLAVWK